MEEYSLSRWQGFYLDDAKLGDIPPSACAKQAAGIFAENNSRVILDLGCGTGRDTLCLANGGAKVVGLDAAHSGLLLAQKRAQASQLGIPWVESDARVLPFADATFEGVYCFGLLHEFVGESAVEDVSRVMDEIQRVLKPCGVAIVATAAGDPEKGLPHVQNFSEGMFDAATAEFGCIEKKVYDDLGCTGRTDYKVWFGHFVKGGKADKERPAGDKGDGIGRRGVCEPSFTGSDVQEHEVKKQDARVTRPGIFTATYIG